MMSDVEKQDVTTWLASLYEAGTQAPNMTAGVVKGFRNETFAAEGCGVFALIAFLHGADSDVKSFNVLNVLGLAKT
jgi:ParB family chromosome partitioning protein